MVRKNAMFIAKLYRRVPSRTLPIDPCRHFCCRTYRLATIAGRLSFSQKTHSDKPDRRNFLVWNSSVITDHGYSRRISFCGSILQLYCKLYAVRSAFLATATLLVAISPRHCSNKRTKRIELAKDSSEPWWSRNGRTAPSTSSMCCRWVTQQCRLRPALSVDGEIVRVTVMWRSRYKQLTSISSLTLMYTRIQ